MKRSTSSPLLGSPPPIGSPRDRQGAFLIVAMICLLLATGLMGTLLKMAVLTRQQAKLEASGLQADWLVESALDRAAAKLASDPAYQGETWKIAPAELGGAYAGEVAITVQADENGRLVEVTARYPIDGPAGVRRTKRLTVSAPPAVRNADPEDTSPASAEKTGSGTDEDRGR